MAHILKAFYDCDILTEEAILDWGSKSSKKTVGKELAEEMRSKAAPFLKWLQEADEEESSSEDDSADDEDDPWTEPKKEPTNGSAAYHVKNADDPDADKDFNIDDI